MSELLPSTGAAAEQASPASPAALQRVQPCEECLGSGGWYRYEPALEPGPGLLYLSCLHCRGSGSGRSAPAQA